MLEGFMDMRGETVELLGGDVTEQDIDVAVDAIMYGDRTTATPALAEFNALTQSEEGIRKLCGMMSDWAAHERLAHHPVAEQETNLALEHIRGALNGKGY